MIIIDCIFDIIVRLKIRYYIPSVMVQRIIVQLSSINRIGVQIDVKIVSS
jgi:hypothetical protein